MYTIYESIGRSVVVPYCGSKTINVRLTVSPDAKSANIQAAATSAGGVATTTAAPTKAVFSRKYRYKSRRLVPAAAAAATNAADSDAAAADIEHTRVHTTSPAIGKFKCQLSDDLKKELPPSSCCGGGPPAADSALLQCPQSTPVKQCGGENHYEIVQDVMTKVAAKSPAIVAALQRLEEEAAAGIAPEDILAAGNYSCRECSSQCPLIDVTDAATTAAPPKPRKLMRKSRSKKQKTPKSSHARVRSLSVGNENCMLLRNNHQLSVRGGGGGEVLMGGKQMTSGGSNAGGDECLNNLRRNDLIDIIRESMEKNRLCFQSNG